MRLPFTTDQFLGVFHRYNEAVWPAQVALVLLAVAALALAARGEGSVARGRAVAGVLALLWTWMGVAYHLAFFRAINPAAVVFGVAFVAQGAALLWYGVRRGRLAFRVPRGLRSAAGWLLVAYALVGYPLLGIALGHRYPAAPTFGLPCPTTIFTLGLLLWTERPPPWGVLAIPLAWAAIGTSAAVQLGMREDFGLAVAAVVVVAVTLRERLGPRLKGELKELGTRN